MQLGKGARPLPPAGSRPSPLPLARRRRRGSRGPESAPSEADAEARAPVSSPSGPGHAQSHSAVQWGALTSDMTWREMPTAPLRVPPTPTPPAPGSLAPPAPPPRRGVKPLPAGVPAWGSRHKAGIRLAHTGVTDPLPREGTVPRGASIQVMGPLGARSPHQAPRGHESPGLGAGTPGEGPAKPRAVGRPRGSQDTQTVGRSSRACPHTGPLLCPAALAT